ncbi:hypothetical protein DAPPUDRAFT_334867 [Daphnia pulex]|uniref:Peptidase C19 ubiquitin carboxyl-terminal hydrolase domain-containing protein n=1 Tax=Daphnia pulex TaxID=6669 RepID=E9HWK9_DAPPU|nr:hypothetical protein DAPPUDRAFT_334867 [Daphnia pulex]|eukprot:EFX63875.1 hypothetical protein DAPPUDRAFT_334867 [Daphnia pulex]
MVSTQKFVNIRNCCFVNSALQAIFSLEEVCLDIEGKLPDIRLTLPILFDKFVKLMAKRGASDQKLVNVIHSDVMQHVTQLLDPLYGLGRQQDAHELFVRIFQYCAEKLPVVMPAVLQDQFENFVFQEVICQRVLIICLKMFANGTKIGVKIAFLEVWQSFADEEDDGPQYMLQAHITHFGDSVNSGNVGFSLSIGVSQL